jgi:hypothetical protein
MAAIEPGQTVLVAALPIPAYGLSMLADVVERLYGTGETMLEMSDGEIVRIYAPADGFGPRLGGPLPETEPGSGLISGIQVRSMAAVDDSLEITFEEAQHICVSLAGALAGWFDGAGGTNYVTARFTVPGAEPFAHRLTVQREDRPSAHELREVAEARVVELEAVLRAHGIEVNEPQT